MFLQKNHNFFITLYNWKYLHTTLSEWVLKKYEINKYITKIPDIIKNVKLTWILSDKNKFIKKIILFYVIVKINNAILVLYCL